MNNIISLQVRNLQMSDQRKKKLLRALIRLRIKKPETWAITLTTRRGYVTTVAPSLATAPSRKIWKGLTGY